MYLFAHLAFAFLLALGWNRLRPSRRINVWLSCAAGILPDLIDKPMSLVVPGMDHHTRAFAHTLLFLLILALAGHRHPVGLALAIGTASHLALDGPWTFEKTLFWPLLGWEFHTGGEFDEETVLMHLSRPFTAAGEVIGFVVLIVAAGAAWMRKRRARRGRATGAASDASEAPRPNGPPDGSRRA